MLRHKTGLVASILLFGLAMLSAGCGRSSAALTQSSRQSYNHPAHQTAGLSPSAAPDSCRLILVPLGGETPLDGQILQAQDTVRASTNPVVALERLGWLFVSKARVSFDSGYYKLAEQCALCMETKKPASQEALLLRGHVLHNLHRFKEAEPLARQLATQRGLPADFGLLADALMEQGKLDEAIAACQTMLDLRPDLHSYARGAHLRWLKGDLAGAESLMSLAASAASPLDPESAAWVNTRLAAYQFQSGAITEANQTCAAALDFQKDFPPALLLQGRMLMAQGRFDQAATVLQRAAMLNPLPEYQWALADALRASNKTDQAAQVETELRQKGALSDPRTYSLFLATRDEAIDTALSLAEAELNSRADVFSHDALAWALSAAGRGAEAQEEEARALAEGTQDARLFFHAAVIARNIGEYDRARLWAERAMSISQNLMPSERQRLAALIGSNPNSEGRDPKEAREPKSDPLPVHPLNQAAGASQVHPSDLGLLSAFDLRISDFTNTNN